MCCNLNGFHQINSMFWFQELPFPCSVTSSTKTQFEVSGITWELPVPRIWLQHTYMDFKPHSWALHKYSANWELVPFVLLVAFSTLCQVLPTYRTRYWAYESTDRAAWSSLNKIVFSSATICWTLPLATMQLPYINITFILYTFHFVLIKFSLILVAKQQPTQTSCLPLTGLPSIRSLGIATGTHLQEKWSTVHAEPIQSLHQ